MVAVLERLILIVEQRVDALRAHLFEERVPLHLLALGQVEVYVRGVVDGPAKKNQMKKRQDNTREDLLQRVVAVIEGVIVKPAIAFDVLGG